MSYQADIHTATTAGASVDEAMQYAEYQRELDALDRQAESYIQDRQPVPAALVAAIREGARASEAMLNRFAGRVQA